MFILKNKKSLIVLLLITLGFIIYDINDANMGMKNWVELLLFEFALQGLLSVK